MTAPIMTDQSVLAAWGVTTTAGYLLTHTMGVAGTELLGLSPFASIIAVWTALMLVPVGMTTALAARRQTDAHHWVWAGLVALGMLANVAAVAAGGGSHAAHGHSGSESHGDTGGTSDSGHSSAAEAASSDSGGHAHSDGGHSESATSENGRDATSTASPDTGDAATASEALPSGDPAGGDTANAETGSGLFDGADLQHASFYHVWFLVGALGFAYSAAAAHGRPRRTLYGTAALLNALMVIALVAMPGAQDVAFLVAAAIQGLPMLVDLPLRARSEGTAAA